MTRNSKLDAVIRRFCYAGERPRSDDQIVDLVAALEALLLAEIGEQQRGELKYRTAQRGAFFIDGSGLTRREVQQQLRRAYDVRSAVAHGGSPSADSLKLASGAAAPLTVFAEHTEGLVRSALRKAIEAVGSGSSWPPDWNALILEGATYP